jgi:hypothetical protein
MGKSLTSFMLRLIVAVALIWLFVGSARLLEACRLLIRCRPAPILASFAIMVLGILVKTVKWQVFLGAEGIHMGYWRLFRYYMASCFFNVFLPSSVGGDVKRMFDVALDTQRRAASVGSILADRGTGMYVLIVYCVFVTLWRWSKIGGWYVSGPILLLTGGITVGVPVALLAFHRIHPWLAGRGRLSDQLLRVLQSVVVQVRHPLGMAAGLSLSFVFLLLTILQVWYLAQALSITVPWEALFVSVPMVFGLASLPITINGIGIREGGFIYFLGLYGIAPESAVAVSLGILALLIALGLLGGMIFLASPSSFRKMPQEPAKSDRSKMRPSHGATGAV